MEGNRAETSKCKLELTQPRLLKKLENSELYSNLIEVARDVELRLERITEVFPNYTLHNIGHSIRVMEYIYDLIFDIEKLSELEIAMLIYSAMLHDVGMYVEPEDVELIQSDKYRDSDDSYPAMLRYYNNNEQLTLQNYVRKIHGERSAKYIRDDIKTKLNIPSQPATLFSEELALICEGHAKDISWLQNKLKSSFGEKGRYYYNTLYCALLLRLGDILDIDSQRTPPSLYEILKLQEISDEEWRQHFVIENQEKVKVDEDSKHKNIVLYGKCTHVKIHRNVLRYIDGISSEVINAVKLTKDMDKSHQLKINPAVQDKIETIGFSFSNFKLNIDFIAITELLMGEKIYGAKKLGLRELIQNSIDACKVLKEIEDSIKEYYDEEYKPTIKVIVDSANNKVIVRDNGKGMSFDILKKYFLNVGVSYYKSNDFLFKNYKYKPIGSFGIGFLAAFMLSSEVIVKTRHYNEAIRYDISLIKGSEYICLEDQEDTRFKGTEIILNYTEFLRAMENDEDNIYKFLSSYFLTDGIDLELVINDKKITKKVNNPLQKEIDDSGYNINLSDYLVDVEGYVHVEVNKTIHGASLSDIPYMGDAYYFDGEKLIRINDPNSFDLALLYKDYSIKFLEIPIITEDLVKEYKQIYEILDDQDEALTKLIDKHNLDWISIFLNVDSHDQISKNEIIEYGDIIVDNLSFYDLTEFEQYDSVPTKVYFNDFKNFFDFDRKFFLPFKDYERDFYLMNSRNIYIRNVLVSNTSIRLINYLSPIKVKELRLNILNEKIGTDLSRNSLTPESQKVLVYAVTKAIHIWALKNLSLSDDKISVLKDYLNTFYEQDNILIKKE